MRIWSNVLVAVIAVSGAAYAESGKSDGCSPAGLMAEWNFDEGEGDVAHDASGNGHDAKLYGATWVKQGDGFAIKLEGKGDYVDCGEARSLGIGGAVSIEAWVKTPGKWIGEARLFGGDSVETYLLRCLHGEYIFWYIGSGFNHVAGRLRIGEWNHVVATFDGKQISLWVNGRLSSSQKSLVKSYEPRSHFLIGTKGPPNVPRFRGMVDKVRVYNRALKGEEVVAHFKGEAGRYGFDPTWFKRVKVKPYYYFDRGEVVVEVDYRGLQPLEGKGRLEVTLCKIRNRQHATPNPEIQTIHRQVIDPVPDAGVVEVKLPCAELTLGSYVIRVSFQDGSGARPVEELTFSYPPKPHPFPSPAAKVVAPLPPELKPTPFAVKVGKGGGFQLTIKGRSYPFESRVSWPNGDFNRLTAGDEPYGKGEKSWKVRVRAVGKDRYEVKARGDFYTIRREIGVFPTHVYVKDTYTNTTDNDLGLLIYNEVPIKPGQVTGSWLSGYEMWGRQAGELNYSPSLFFTDANTGIGMVPIDDVYVVQAVPYVEEHTAGVCTEKFALAPSKSYTLEWAVFPTGSRNYYDFINTFRRVEGRIGTISEAPGFISRGPSPASRRIVPDKDFIEKRGLKIGIIHCLSQAADDPKLSIEGIEFMDFPKEMALLKEQAAAIKKKHPGFKVVFHIAHSLYCTNNPDRFADSKVIDANGRHAIWGDTGAYISLDRQKEGWQWWIFYSTPGNSFHDALMKSVDVMMDEIGMDGAFMDGFLAGYCGLWTYDGRWDGHSAEIDLNTKTIRRKKGSVLLLSQPSMIEFARKVRDKGGVVIASNTVFTRSISKEKHIIFIHETITGPQMHLAPTLAVLCQAPPVRTEKTIYLDMLDKLSWGELFVYYQEGINLTYPSLASKQYPITFEEIRSGLVRGKERIVTMNSGVYGWRGDRRLHLVFKFDGRGAPVSHDFITTVDKGGVRTELKFNEDESAVIEPIPAVLETTAPVNARVLSYNANGLHLLLNGKGKTLLQVRSGLLPITAGAAYRVTASGKTTTIKGRGGTLFIPLKLDGQVEVVIERAVGV